MEIRKKLAQELTDYVNRKKTQEECTGFIDGFERACDLIEALAKTTPETRNCNLSDVIVSVCDGLSLDCSDRETIHKCNKIGACSLKSKLNV